MPITVLESAAVQPTPAVTTSAPSSSPSTAPPNTIEYRVGAIVAAAGIAIAEALAERADGGLTPTTKMRGGNLIAELFRLRQFLIADFPNFDAMAREHGTAALRAADVSPRIADVLVSEILDLLHKVVRAALN